MKRREFLAATAGAAVLAARQGRVAGQAGAYTLVPGPLGKTLRTPDGRPVFEYMTSKPAETDMVDGNTSWPDSPWYARAHVLNGKTAGYAVGNHASNPRTRWWNPPSTGNIQPSIVTYGEYTIPNGQTLTLKYLVVAYDGEFSGERLTELTSAWRTS